MKRSMFAFGLAVATILASSVFTSGAYAQEQRREHNQGQQRKQDGGRVERRQPQHVQQTPQVERRQPQVQQQPQAQQRQPQVQDRRQGNQDWRNRQPQVRDQDRRRGNDGNDRNRHDNDRNRHDNDRGRHDNDWRNGQGNHHGQNQQWRREPHVNPNLGQYRRDHWIHRGPAPSVRFHAPAPSRYNYVQRGGHYNGRWQPRGGFEFFAGFYFGGVQFNTSFFAPSDYCPTDWIFEVRYGRWHRPGGGYVYSAPVYQGPITVAVEEEVVVGSDAWGNPDYELVTVYYNANYYPGYGRYGYVDIDGDFNWLN